MRLTGSLLVEGVARFEIIRFEKRGPLRRPHAFVRVVEPGDAGDAEHDVWLAAGDSTAVVVNATVTP